MRLGPKLLLLFCLAGLVFQAMPVRAQLTAEELHRETLAACAASANARPSLEIIREKVDKACDLLSKEGKAAFSKFKGMNSEFIFCGTYIYVHDLKGVMRLEPAIPQMEGVVLRDVKDGHNKRPFFEMNKVAKERGAGWVDYWWPRPGESKPSRKTSYVKLCRVDGEDLVVGAGIYDLPDSQVHKVLMGQGNSPLPAKEREKAGGTPKTTDKFTEPQPATSPMNYVGSRTSNKYHYPDCKWARTIPPKKVIWFGSVAEAKKKGYIHCPACKPPLTDKPGAE